MIKNFDDSRFCFSVFPNNISLWFTYKIQTFPHMFGYTMTDWRVYSILADIIRFLSIFFY